MSTLNVSNITDGTDTVETGYVVNGSAKAWLKSNYSSGTPIIQNSLNISSLGDTGTGNQTVSFTNSMAGANEYAAVGAPDNSGGSVTSRINYSNHQLTADSFLARTYNIYSVDTWRDTGMHITVAGDLA